MVRIIKNQSPHKLFYSDMQVGFAGIGQICQRLATCFLQVFSRSRKNWIQSFRHSLLVDLHNRQKKL